MSVLLWQYPSNIDYFHMPDMYEADRAGLWFEQDITTLWHQDAYAALHMLAASKLPSMIEIEGGYICSKSIYPSVRRKHKKSTTYDNLLKKCKPNEQTFYELCGKKMALNVSTNTITIEA